jgi:DNA-binding response OmpR family regulator
MPAPPLPLSHRHGPPRRPAVAGPARVFICDDDLDFARELAEGLIANGFETRTLAGGLPATEIFDGFVPGIILLDIFMPPPDGFEMINHICALSNRREMSLILMSGAGTDLLEVASRFCIARRLRLAAVFQKPIDLREIVRLCRIHTRR